MRLKILLYHSGQKINCLETEACFDCAVQFSKYGLAQGVGSCLRFNLRAQV